MIIKYYVAKGRAEGDGKGTYLRLNSCWRRQIYLPVYKMFWRLGRWIEDCILQECESATKKDSGHLSQPNIIILY